MEHKVTQGNMVLIKLDASNTSIKLKNDFILYIDDTFEPEKNITVTGEVYGLPSHLAYSGKANIGMPWLTDLELKCGDKVICYYLAIANALTPQHRRYVLEGEDRYVMISYENIYVAIRGEQIIPVNGYCLIEPSDDPAILAEKERMAKMGMELVKLNTQSNTNVSYGIVRYAGTPNKSYVDDVYTDDGVDVKAGDFIVLRKINDIPLQYPLHSKLDGGKLYWRVQRRNILAKV